MLDLGGTPQFWTHAPQRPRAVTVVNLEEYPSDEFVTAVRGDACDPPPPIRGGEFDLVVSNSLIEHVGGHFQRARLAAVVRESADRYWVQTPYRYFPLEPHWMFPGLQFLPFEARVRVTQRWRFGNRYTPSRQTAVDSVNEVDLIGLTQMRCYFPDAQIWTERMAGLVKSVVAIRS